MVKLSPRQWLILGGSAAAGALLWKYGGNPVVPVQIAGAWVSNVFERGSVLSSSTLVSGVVQPDPQTLIAQASAALGFAADADTYTLARMGRSEGVDGMEFRMHVVLNMLAADQAAYGTGIYSSVTALATHSKNASADGSYSKQALGKPFSTAHDPYAGDYALAQKVQSDRASGIDPTGGAIKFVDKDGLFSLNGKPASYDDVVAAWAQQGLTPQTLPGASDNFVVFVKA